MLTVARAVGVLCSLALIVVAVAVGAAGLRSYTSAPAPEPGQEFRFTGRAEGLEGSPALAMEFADKEEEVRQYLDQPGMRQKVRGGLAADNVFIAAYWLLFAGLCVLLARREFKLRVGRFVWRYALWLAVFAAVCVTGAAVTDTVENAHTAAVLDATAFTPQPTEPPGDADAARVTRQLVANVAAASFQKWTLVALATLALSPVFLWGGVGWARRFGVGLFVLYLFAGALMLFGVLWGRPRWIVAAFYSTAAGSAVIAFVFTLRPGWAAGVSKDAAEETRRATR